jgi:putative resolvase
MKLAAWARANGVHPQTAYRWFRQGRMPVPARRLPSGTILVEVAGGDGVADHGAVLYARVSAHDQRADLDRQVARLTGWAAGNGVEVAEVVTEVGSGVGSGLNGRRPKLARLLADPTVAMIVVEHRDRLARFGAEHLEAALSAHGRRLLVVDASETEISDDLVADLVADMIEVLTSFCARLYGRRGARNRAVRAVTCARTPSGRPEGGGAHGAHGAHGEQG